MIRAALLLSIVGVFSLNGCSSTGNGGATGTGGSGGSNSGLGGVGDAGSSVGGNAGSNLGGRGGSTGLGGTGGSTAACGSATGTGSGDTCSSLAAGGPCVTPQLSTGTAPTPSGGPIGAGTYVLTSETLYGGGDGGIVQPDRRETLVVSAVTSTSFTLNQVTVSGSRADRSSGTVAVTGTMVTYTPTCPPPGDGGNRGASASFTATSTTVTLIQSQSVGTQVSVYTKS